MYKYPNTRGSRVKTLVFIDYTVEDFQSLVKVLLPSSEVIIIQPNSQEIEQITQTLNKYTQIKNLHIIANGSPGCLYFGDSHLNLFVLKRYTDQLKTWSVKNILLYGRNVAAENIGKKFIQNLHLLTGANIGASVWKENGEGKGVCLKLNYFLGDISPDLAILPKITEQKITAILD